MNNVRFTFRRLEELGVYHIFGKLRTLISNDEVEVEEFDFMGSFQDAYDYMHEVKRGYNAEVFVNGHSLLDEESCFREDYTKAGEPVVDGFFKEDVKIGYPEVEFNERKKTPVYTGFVKYFPNAMKEVSRASLVANDQHHEGTPLHWDMEKSSDELDALMRHLIDHASGEDFDDDGIRHLTKVAWRGMAMLERVLTNKVK